MSIEGNSIHSDEVSGHEESSFYGSHIEFERPHGQSVGYTASVAYTPRPSPTAHPSTHCLFVGYTLPLTIAKGRLEPTPFSSLGKNRKIASIDEEKSPTLRGVAITPQPALLRGYRIVSSLHFSAGGACEAPRDSALASRAAARTAPLVEIHVEGGTAGPNGSTLHIMSVKWDAALTQFGPGVCWGRGPRISRLLDFSPT